MKCFKCKTQITKSSRVCIAAKFRDLCEECYVNHYTELGYVLRNNVWIKEKSKAQIIGELIIMNKYQFVQGHLIAEIVEDVIKIQEGKNTK